MKHHSFTLAGATHVVGFGRQLKAAFTLAEVLITLGIIGVVAAITLSPIINKYKEKQTVVRLQKAYSVLQQALTYAEEANGPIETWDLVARFNPEGAVNMMNNFIPYLNSVEVCSNSDSSCVPSMYYYPDKKPYMNLGTDSRTAKLVLNDGTLIMFRTRAKNCDDNSITSNNPKFSKYCAWILVDINGKSDPNALGRDLFPFEVFSSGIYPAGFAGDPVLSFETLCKNINSNNGSRGFGCTAWVIENENMDYLHCNNLSWDGARTCKEAQ